jgi:hypothetical protein
MIHGSLRGQFAKADFASSAKGEQAMDRLNSWLGAQPALFRAVKLWEP